jgi:hypothetical protein
LITGGGIQLLWPATQAWYGLGVPITSLDNILLEWISFTAAGAVMLATKDMQKMFKTDKHNLLLSVPLLTVLLPSLIRFPLDVPPLLLIPHLIYLGIFTIAILIFLKSTLTRKRQDNSTRS